MLNLGAIIFGFLFGVLIGSQIKTKAMDTQFTLASFVIIFIVGLVSILHRYANSFRIFLCINWYFCR